jgi:type IV secretion system protein VirD4
MRAMPMTPPPDGPSGSEADVEAARQAADGQSSGQTDVAPGKTAPVVQAAIAEEQRQMEMDFGGHVTDAEAVSVEDEAQLRTAVDGLDDMEAMLREDSGQKLVVR